MKAYLFWASNILCLILGVYLSIVTHTSLPVTGESNASGGSDDSSKGPKDPRLSSRSVGDFTSQKKDQIAKLRPPDAWRQLEKLTDLSSDERHQLRMAILTDWARSDPEAALRAALETRQDEDFFSKQDPPLITAFTEAMLEQPEAFGELLFDERFGLQTGIARSHWIKVVGEAQPMLLASSILRLKSWDRRQAVKAILDSPNQSQEQLNEWFGQIAELPPTPENVPLLDQIGRALAQESFRDLISMTGNLDRPGYRQMAVSGMVARIGGSSDPDHIRHQLSLLPQSLRNDVVETAAKMITRNPLAYTVIIDEIIQSGDWDLHSQNMSLKFHNMLVFDTEPLAVAEWATTIPGQRQYENLYRVGIRSYLQKYPTAAYEWITSLPSGWHRDNSLVGYIQTSLFAHQNEEKAAQALGLVKDPHFKKEGLGMLEEWKRRQP